MLGLRAQSPNSEPNANLKYLALVSFAILAGFLLLRFWSWIDDSPRSLLPNVPGLVVLDDLDSLADIVPLPSQTFDAQLSTAGIYQQAAGTIPKGTIVVVYERDGWRFIEIDYLSGSVVETYLATHPAPTQEIKLDQARSIWMQTIDQNPRCIDYDDGLLNRCEISRHLIAQLENRLLLIAADGHRATDGELIEIARSIISFDDQDSR